MRGAARGRARRARAGQPAGHRRRASELAAQAAARARSDWAGDARFVAHRTRRSSASAARAHAPPRDRARCRRIVPRATYRVQLHREFTLRRRHARSCPTSRALGISHLYCSPFLRARAGSTHGYDIVDHNALNPEIGTRDDFDALRATTLQRPRHGPDARHRAQPHGRARRRQRVVARRARERPGLALRATSSTSTGSPPTPELPGKVLLPVLGDHYGECSSAASCSCSSRPRRGELRAALLRARFPIDPRDYPRADPGAPSQALPAQAAADAAALRSSAATRSRTCRARDARRASARAERDARQGRAQARSSRAGAPHEPALRAGDRGVRRGAERPRRRAARASTRCTRCSRPGLPPRLLARGRRRDQLPALLRHQRPRRAAHGERRGVRGHAPPACSRWRPSGKVDGLRIDHPDGLYDPAHYFERLQLRYATRWPSGSRDGAAARRSTSWSRRSWPRTSACPRLAGARHHRLSLRQRGQRGCSSTAAREARIDRIYARSSATRRRLRRARAAPPRR